MGPFFLFLGAEADLLDFLFFFVFCFSAQFFEPAPLGVSSFLPAEWPVVNISITKYIVLRTIHCCTIIISIV